MSWDYYTTAALKNIGVSCHTADVRDWFGERQGDLAYCGSKQCAGVRNHADGKLLFKRSVTSTTTYCPDCNQALVWRKNKKH